jgi:hypothetical protein
MKITVVVNEAGDIVAAHIPSGRSPAPTMAGFLPSEGHTVLDLDIPDDAVPTEQGPDFLENLKPYKERTG